MCIEQGHHHGRHAKDDVSAARFQLVKHDIRVKQADQHHSAPRLKASKRDHPAARGVKHRHDVDPGGRLGCPTATRVEPGVVDQSAMAQDCPFGKTGGAGGILDHRRVAWIGIGQSNRAGALCVKRYAFHVRDFANRWDARGDFSPNLAHGVAAEFFDKEKCNRAGLFQHVG